MAQDNPHARLRIQRAAVGVLSLPAGWTASYAGFTFDLRGWLARGIAAQVDQRRLFPWIAVSFGLGILLFFRAEGRPALWAPVAGFALFAAAAIAARHRLGLMAAMVALSALFAGFAAAVIRTRAVDAPMLSRVVITPISGFIEAVEDRGGRARLTLRVTGMERLLQAEWPRRVRVTVRDGRGFTAGQHVAATARLLPPPEPAWPGGYDFARDAYFREIGAVGSLLGAITRPASPSPPDWSLRVAAAVDEARNVLTERIAGAIGGPAGAVAAALVTGKRGLIDEPTNDVLRAAGIYHIVSISGLHMVLAAGTFFWLARALLALSPGIALLWPVKRIAAAAAMAGACLYCIFSGSEVATERSLIMTLVMFGAVMVDRPALSVRNLAITPLVVLAREPETLIGPSFQMSFGAVAALIALAPWLGRRREEDVRGPVSRAIDWGVRSILGLLATTLVASLATAPFAAYHFQTVNPFGLVGNALALPLVSLVVMPAALLGVVAYPFGLDRPVWQLMGWAVAQVLDVSAWVSGFSGSSLLVPALGVGAVAAFASALVLVTVPVSVLRWLAVIPLGAGLALAAVPDRYDAFVDREGSGAAIRGRAGAPRPRRQAVRLRGGAMASCGRRPEGPQGREPAPGCPVRSSGLRGDASGRPRRRLRRGPRRVRGGLPARRGGRHASSRAADLRGDRRPRSRGAAKPWRHRHSVRRRRRPPAHDAWGKLGLAAAGLALAPCSRGASSRARSGSSTPCGRAEHRFARCRGRGKR